MKRPIIYSVKYHEFDNINSVEALRKNVVNEKISEKSSKYIVDYPTVYIIENKGGKKGKHSVYVGETNNIFQRTKEHLNVDSKKENRDDWIKLANDKKANMYVIGQEHFNKSLTLDIENQMMLYLMGANAVDKLNNRRGNYQNMYYTSEEKDKIFKEIWKLLNRENNELFPAESLIKDSAIFKASPFHKLNHEQFKAKEELEYQINSFLKDQKRRLILVEGEAGAGKTVLLSTLLYSLINDGVVKKNKIRLFVRHKEQQKVYEEIAQKLDLTYKDEKGKTKTIVVDHPVAFIKKNEEIDVAMIDEAHLLLTQENRGYSSKTSNKISANQLNDIMNHAKITIAIMDKYQVVANDGLKNLTKIKELESKASCTIDLKNQMRMKASAETREWIKSFIYDGCIRSLPKDDNYEIKIFDSPKMLEKAIKKQDRCSENGASRMVATYDWEYKDGKNNNGKFWNVEIGDWKKPWNYQIKYSRKDIAWAEIPETINEIGSIYTIQGFDLNYCGVIIGPSIKYRNGKVVIDIKRSCNKKVKTHSIEQSEILIKNALNVLMTRGVNGLYLYACDEELRKQLLLLTK